MIGVIQKNGSDRNTGRVTHMSNIPVAREKLTSQENLKSVSLVKMCYVMWSGWGESRIGRCRNKSKKVDGRHFRKEMLSLYLENSAKLMKYFKQGGVTTVAPGGEGIR